MGKPSKLALRTRISRWVALQVASKTVSVALGTPIISGAVMAALAYTSGLPLAATFFAAMGVAAFASVILNQGRAFVVAYSVAGKVSITGGELAQAISRGGRTGYGFALKLTNKADIPLEYRVERVSAHIAGSAILGDDPDDNEGSVIKTGLAALYHVGVAAMPYACSQQLSGEFEYKITYGRPGRLKHVIEEKGFIHALTDAEGEIIDARLVNRTVLS